MGRHQLPVYSPLPFSAVTAALVGGDARAWLSDTLRERYGSAAVVLTDSGTSALALALVAATALRPGLPCALPGYACYDLATAARSAGVHVVLYDLDPRTLAPEPASLARALAGGVAALVVVHLYGVPVPMDAARTAADAAGAVLIEDAAQGSGGSWSGRPLGSVGDLAVLSFGRGKGMTGGGGGALLARDARHLPSSPPSPAGVARTDPALATKLLGQWLLGRPSVYGIPASIPFLRLGETIYHEPAPVRALRPASARVLAQTLPCGPAEHARREVHGDRLRRAAERAGLQVVVAPAGGTAGLLRLPLLLPPVHAPHGPREARLGIMPGYPMPLEALDALAPVLVRTTPMPGAARLARDLWTLPTHGRLTERDLRALEGWLARLVSGSL